MIRRLQLKDWRNYKDFTVDFEAGTTFVVASNGVGKTSLVEAARWALFGLGSGGTDAVRAGASSASAAIELELPDLRVLRVERTLTARPNRAAVPPVVHIDGARVPHEQLVDLLIGAYGTEPRFLAGLTMPATDRSRDRPAELGLEGHLGQYYGITGLRDAVDRLNAMRRSTDTKIKKIKSADSVSSQQLARLRSATEEAALEVKRAEEAHARIQDNVARAQDWQRYRVALRKWNEDNASRDAATGALAVQLEVDLSEPVRTNSVEDFFDERLADMDRKIEDTRINLALSTARQSKVAVNQDRLDAAQDDCPVCRRPLDDSTVTGAHELNALEFLELEQSLLSLRAIETELIAERERLRSMRAEWRRIPPPKDRPQAPTGSDDGRIDSAGLALTAQTALNTLVDRRAAHLQSRRELDSAVADNDAARQLESLFRRDAILRIAVESTESTLTDLLNETIRPLAAEVDQRWRALFPDRGELNTYSDGNMTRLVNGHSLSYDSFSTGEGTSATLLFRLLVAQMATTADFCWFDEPLEHLDPEVRRHVASLLSRVADGAGPLKQVVVTTYEEPLARHLHVRDKQRVKLVDVRQAR